MATKNRENDTASYTSSYSSSSYTKTKTDTSSVDTHDTIESMLMVKAPRRNCEQIAPSVVSLIAQDKKKALHHIKAMLKRSRVDHWEKHLRHIHHFDHSDKIVPEGEVSKRLYNELLKKRQFDIYGRPLYIDPEHAAEEEARFLAKIANKEYKPPRISEKDDEIRRKAPPVFDHNTVFQKPPIFTSQWKVGNKEKYNAPVGFASNPGEILNSEGHEAYYAYDGEWKDGCMDGIGTYLFPDGMTYHGAFKKNRHHGVGTATYPVGSTYEGEWQGGKYHGHGVLKCAGGSEYDGYWKYGRRNGQGRVVTKGGLSYEGEWKDGRPHGRGVMKSSLTNYTYEGTFEKGSIQGSGTLITPDGERIVRYWPYVEGGQSLPGIVRMLAKEREDFYTTQAENKKVMNATRSKLYLEEYVAKVRTELHEGRAKEKREKLIAQMNLIKEQKEKMREAKLRALAGEEEPEEAPPINNGPSSDDDADA